MAIKTEHHKLLARCGYFSLMLIVPLWHLWLSPPLLGLNPWFITAIWFVPLLFPLRGIIKGNPYTFAWCGFLALLYIMHAVVVIYTAYIEGITIEILLGFIELVLLAYFSLAASILLNIEDKS